MHAFTISQTNISESNQRLCAIVLINADFFQNVVLTFLHSFVKLSASRGLVLRNCMLEESVIMLVESIVLFTSAIE